jgi:nucleotide-binding universal stress UspA family protein
MKRIVVGLDLTPTSDVVVEWVERFAADTGVQVIVVHAAPRTLLWVLSSVQADFTIYLNNVRAQLEHDVIDRLRNKGISAELLVPRGDAAHELAKVAARVDADMIVIGGAHHIALHDVVFGGTARHLERLTRLPVVVVPLKTASAHGAP